MVLLLIVDMSGRELEVPVRRNVTDPVSPMPTGFLLIACRTLFTAPRLLVSNVVTTRRILVGLGRWSGLRSTTRV